MSLVPTFIAANIAKIAAGNKHLLAIGTNGNLYGAGMNNLGQLGDGSNTDTGTLVFITGSVIDIAAGNNHSLFLASG